MFVHGSVKAPGSRSLLSCSLAISRPQHQRGQSHAARLVFQQQQHLPRKVWLTRHQRTVSGAVYSIIYQVMFTIKRCGIQYLPHPSAGVAARQRPFGEEDLCQTRFSPLDMRTCRRLRTCGWVLCLQLGYASTLCVCTFLHSGWMFCLYVLCIHFMHM